MRRHTETAFIMVVAVLLLIISIAPATTAFTPVAHLGSTLHRISYTPSPQNPKHLIPLNLVVSDQLASASSSANRYKVYNNEHNSRKKNHLIALTKANAWLFLHANLQTLKHWLVAATLIWMLTLSPLMASAVMSGGRMGGSFSSSKQSTGRVAPSRSSSGSTYSAPGSSPSSSRSYSSPSVYSSSSYSAPAYSSHSEGSSGAAVASSDDTGDPLVDLLVSLLAYAVYAIARTLNFLFDQVVALFESVSAAVSRIWSFFLSTFSAFLQLFSQEKKTETSATPSRPPPEMTALGPGTSVAQISVAMQVLNRDDPNSILSVLHRLSETATTDSRDGIQALTSQVATELLGCKSAITAAYTIYKHFDDKNDAQREFSELSIKERSKFEQELVNKFGGVDYVGPVSWLSRKVRPRKHGATLAVVTLVLEIQGNTTQVSSHSLDDVEASLRTIASHAKIEDCLQSAEILWTPEDRGETLTERELAADYPDLHPL